MLSRLIFQGNVVSIHAIEYKGAYPAFDFFESLDDSDKIKLMAIFEMLDLMQNRFRNPEKFKKLIVHDHETFMEIKSFQIRIGCFWQPSYKLLATHGFIKKKSDWPTPEIQRLKDIYNYWKQQR